MRFTIEAALVALLPGYSSPTTGVTLKYAQAILACADEKSGATTRAFDIWDREAVPAADLIGKRVRVSGTFDFSKVAVGPHFIDDLFALATPMIAELEPAAGHETKPNVAVELTGKLRASQRTGADLAAIGLGLRNRVETEHFVLGSRVPAEWVRAADGQYATVYATAWDFFDRNRLTVHPRLAAAA